MEEKCFICSVGQLPPCRGESGARQTEVKELELPGESGLGRGIEGRWWPGAGRGARCWGRVSSGPQVSVIPVLWEPRIRREERGRCTDIAGDAARARGGLGFMLCFFFPFYCSL